MTIISERCLVRPEQPCLERCLRMTGLCRHEQIGQDRVIANIQDDLTQIVGRSICGGIALKPMGGHGTWRMDRDHEQVSQFACTRLIDFAFTVITRRVEAHCHPNRIVDHAWYIGAEAAPHEPWALVCEPYMSMQTARSITELAMDIFSGQGLFVHAFDPNLGSYNRGQCVPIVFGIAGDPEIFLRSVLAGAGYAGLDRIG